MVPGNNTVNIQLTENNFFEFFLDFTGGKVIETEVTLIIDSDCSEEPESSLSLVNTETYTNSENEERYVTIYRDTVALSDVSFKYHFNRTAVLEEFTEIVSGLI
ncbi:unnamed protein product [Caenorhabditis angaria]|uniref:Uncharacterized protein n=1 Tax=Caenorhabditis angaria TaxID=860376 RepID=A0A9P1N1M3_9PELO|nr:unnamed protein product [Caenorhabditis angaria]